MTVTTRSALITGACGDIGSAIARQFAGRNMRLALCDLRPEQDAGELLEELRRDAAAVLYRQLDVTDAAAIEKFVRDAAAENGLDLCIANAGIVERGLLAELSAEAWRKQIDVNLTGCFLTAQAAARVIQASGTRGHIVFISSWVQDIPRETIGAYCVSKSGLKMLAKCMALELARSGIRVNLIAPGFVDAGLTGENLRRNPGKRPEIEASIPLGRLITAGELAEAVMLLCADEASYLTGSTLLVDGGSSLFFRK